MPRNLKRLRSCDSSEGSCRSRSATPVPKRARESEQRARRCLQMVSAAASAPRERDVECDEEPRMWRPTVPASAQRALGVNVTPGGSVRVTGVVEVEKTPGGRIRRKQELQQSIFLRPEEIAAECGLDEEEALEAAEDHVKHVSKWGVQLQSGTPERMSPSRSMSEPAGDLVELLSGTVSVDPVEPRSSTSGEHRSARNSFERVDATPSCSGTTLGSSNRHPAEPENEGSDLDSDHDDDYDLDEIITSRNPMRRAIPDDDELDENVRNMVSSVETEMDAAIDRLVGESSGFDWQEDFSTFRGVQETFSGPTPGPVKDYDTPYEAFCDIWDDDIIGRMVIETNKYARQSIDDLRSKGKLKPKSRLHKWVDTDANEIRVLISMYTLMGIAQRTSQHEYWKTSGLLQLPYFRSLMAFNRFILLNKFLHFADNSDVSQNLPQVGGTMLSAKLRKIAPLLAHLNSKFESLYNLQQDIAIDESLTLFKGRLSWVQAIRSKAARFGIKSFELCESRSGYLYRFEIYTGKNSAAIGDTVNPSADLAGKSAQVVLDLLKGLENRGHCVTMDNYYNSPALARYLKRSGFDCLGTLRANRKNVPEKIKKLPKKVKKGEITALHSGDVACISWQDSRMVNMISTYHDSETILSRKAGKDLTKPVVVNDYNNTMGGVDLKDQKLSMYLVERKRCLKWYMKIFKRLLNVSVHNAFIMLNASRARRNLPLMTHRDFREELAESLVMKHHKSPPECAVAFTESEMRLRRDLVHVPKVHRGRQRKRCHLHYRQGLRQETNTSCVTCGDVYLCLPDCWIDWHSLRHLPGRDIVTRSRK